MATVHDRIKGLRLAAHMTQEELAAKMQVSKGAVGNYETGKRTPDLDALEAIADIFNVDIDYLAGRVNVLPEFNLEEQWLISCYRKADEDIQTAVKTILRKFDAWGTRIVEKPKKIIPLFGASFAAGPGEPDFDSPVESIEVDADSKADFAARVIGDSMEPELHDGEIVLCQTRQAEIGDIVVCFVNGAFYVKQYAKNQLLSINRKRKDMDIVFNSMGDYSVKVFGTVIHRRIPLVK